MSARIQNHITGRLSLRPPQTESLARLVRALEASERWPNLTLKKIPKMVLARCEWGHDDYSLNVANLPMAQAEPQTPSPLPSPSGGKGGRAQLAVPDLFGDGGEG